MNLQGFLGLTVSFYYHPIRDFGFYRTIVVELQTPIYSDGPCFSFYRTTENLASTSVALKQPRGAFRRLTGNFEANANLQSPNIERWLQSPNPRTTGDLA